MRSSRNLGYIFILEISSIIVRKDCKLFWNKLLRKYHKLYLLVLFKFLDPLKSFYKCPLGSKVIILLICFGKVIEKSVFLDNIDILFSINLISANLSECFSLFILDIAKE